MVIYELGSPEGTKIVRKASFDQPLPGCKLPQEAAAIEELADWSINFRDAQNPFSIFLDLIGYSVDRYGCYCYTYDLRNCGEVLGYKELCMLADALKVFENHGYWDVYSWIDTLCNDSDDDE